MSCKHYDRGQCRAQSHVVTYTAWLGFLAVQRSSLEHPTCGFSTDIWVGSMCVPGAVSISPLEQLSDCALYETG